MYVSLDILRHAICAHAGSVHHDIDGRKGELDARPTQHVELALAKNGAGTLALAKKGFACLRNPNDQLVTVTFCLDICAT